MERNASAIALKIYLAIAVAPICFKAVPLPGTLQNSPTLYGLTSVWLIFAGCLVALAGIAWKDRLDGSVLEQFGCILVALGMLMYGAALAKVFPMSWLPMCMCGGFAMAFAFQWWIIHRWRMRLRRVAVANVGP